MAASTPPGGESTDISDLWTEALKSYYETTGQDLRTLRHFTSVNDIMNDAQLKNDHFDSFRHDKGKIDKLRSAISRNSDLVQKGAEYIAQAATPAFPPSAAILTAFTYVMKACKDVSADYDKITSFFDEMNNFLERVSIIESRMPSVPAYKVFLTRVFASMMNLLAIATKYVKKGRFRKWFRTLLEGGGDDELAGAYGGMETALKRLESATNFATLGNTVDIKRDTKATIVTMERVDITTQQMDMRTQEIQGSLKEGFLQVTEISNQLAENFAKMVENQKREATKRGPPSQQYRSKDPGARKHAAFNLVRRYFAKPAVLLEQARDIQFSFVQGTAEWIFDEGAFKSWSSKKKSVLFLSGGPGVGKSNLAFSIIQKLQQTSDYEARTSVAYFYFKDEHEDLRYMSKAIIGLIHQIAEQDTVYCEQVAAELNKLEGDDLDLTDWLSIWDKYLLPKFPHGTEAHAYLVIDGLDEVALSSEKMLFLGLLKNLQSKKSNIYVLVTLRPMPEYDQDTQKSGCVELHVSKERISADVSRLIDARMDRFKGLSKLGRFRKQVKKKISVELRTIADSMLFVEHMLRRYNFIGREGAVLKDMLKFCPTDLFSLYALMLSECQGRRSPEQYQSLKKLFAWLAFSKRPLTLGEASGLVALTGQDSSFSIEEELEGKSSRILELATPLSAGDESDISDAEDLSKDAEYSEDDGSFPLRFQERSLREYFQAMSVDEEGLRTSPSSAHLTIFENAVSIICGLSTTSLRLAEYSSKYWSTHFIDIDPTAVSEEDTRRVLESLSLVLNNTKDVSKLIEKYSEKYTSTFGVVTTESLQENAFFSRIQEWMNRIPAGNHGLSEHASVWVNDIKAYPLKIMVHLAKGHVKNWFSGPYANVMTTSFEFALDALSMTDLIPALTSKQRENPSPELLISIANLFNDVVKDTRSYRSIGLVLVNYDHYESSLEYFQKSLDTASSDLGRFYNRVSIANTHMYLVDNNREGDDDQPHVEIALKIINEALNIEHHPGTDKIRADIASQTRVAFLSRAKCEGRLKKFKEAVVSYEEAKLAVPTVTMEGKVLNKWVKLITDEELMENLAKWTLWDRMSWLTLDEYDDDEDKDGDEDKQFKAPNERFQVAAKKTDKLQFMVETYEQIIAYLIRSKQAGSPRLHFARAYRNVIGDVKKAKAILYDILDSDACVDSYGDEDIDTVFDTREEISDIIYDEFRASSDPKEKAASLHEFKKLSERRLLRNVNLFGIYTSQTAIVAARMTRIVGTASEFQDILERTFQSCIEGLTDTEGWNDSGSLRLLAKVLVLMGLNWEAQVALSAQFSITDPDVSHDDYSSDEDEEDDSEDEGSDEQDHSGDEKDGDEADGGESTTNGDAKGEKSEGENDTEDLAPGFISCDGECKNTDHNSWQKGAMFSCLVCADCDLCEECYQKRKARNRAELNAYWREYCGKDHQYIKAPVEGWKGIKGGVMRVGEAEIKFADWLKDLKDNKWKQAWKKFWLNEGLHDDIL